MLKSKELDQILNNNKHQFFAHTKGSSSEKELLSEHLQLTYKYYKQMEEDKHLDSIVKRLIKSALNVDEKTAEVGYELFETAIYYHDIGKINPLFQKDKMDNDIHIKSAQNNSTHSVLSARLFIDAFCEECKKYNKKQLIVLIFMFAYIISRHHSDMCEMINFSKEIEGVEEPKLYKNKIKDDQCQKIILDGINQFLKKEKVDEISIYILGKLLYSCIITADYYATYEYINGESVNLKTDKDFKLFEKYKQSELYKKIRKYENENKEEIKGINILRTDIFLETEQILKSNLDSNIYYLEAPTGSGKTNMAINLARILFENNSNIKSINYIFPFNTIIEQTQNTFSEYFTEYKDFITINSISSIVKDVNERLNFESAYVKNTFRQYKIVITSNVNLFSSLFGEGKEINYSLYNYINSVVVIDEIQVYSNNKWRHIIEMIDKYAEMLNIKFIIMSATLPRLDKLLNESRNKFTALVEDTSKYYKNSIFRNRVIVDYSLLNKKIQLDELAEIIAREKNKKVLVECITKKTANELYKILQKMEIKKLYILTGDDNSYYRNKLIEKIKNSNNLILIATQTIEAGVDIDMDIGYKDISFLDNEEQFLGRINRSSKKKNCKAYFFNYDSTSNIYMSDNRIGLGLDKPEIRNYLENKNFIGFYNSVIERIKKGTEQYNSKNISNLYDECKFMNFKNIEKTMRLIEKNTIQLFLNYTININGRKVIGKEVFEKYKNICTNIEMKYTEKKVRLSEVKKDMNLFLYTIYKSEQKVIAAEQFGDVYYIEDGEKYMKEGRFNRELFLSKGDTLFI